MHSTEDDPFDQWGIEETVAEWVRPEMAQAAMAKARQKIVSVSEAKRIEKRKQKKLRKAARRSGLASMLLGGLLIASCCTTHIRGDAGSGELEFEATEQIVIVPPVVGIIEPECATPCGDVCCPERAFCFEGSCKCFAGIEECGDICCPEDTPVCVEGECEP